MMSFAQELAHVAPKLDQAGDAVRVLELEAGLTDLLAVCRAKKVFERPVWTEMHLPATGEEGQLRAFLAVELAAPTQTAVWIADRDGKPAHVRVVDRESSRRAYVKFVIGTGAFRTAANARPGRSFRDALYRVGIREVRWDSLPDHPLRAQLDRLHAGVDWRPGYRARRLISGYITLPPPEEAPHAAR